MRVAQVIDTLHWGGAQELLVMLAAAAQQSDLHLMILSLHGDRHTPYAERFAKLGVPVITFPARKLTDPICLYRLTRFLQRERVDLIQSHLLYANVLGGAAARLAQVPVLGTLHFDKLEHPIWRQKVEAYVLRRTSSFVLAVGHHVARMEQKRLPGKQIAILPNCVSVGKPVSPEAKVKLRAAFTQDSDELMLVSVGRLTVQKGFGDLIEAAASWRDTGHRFRLVIVGDGPLRTVLQNQITELRLHSHVTLAGSRADARQIMAVSDLYICSSHWEGLSISVLEAMAAGLPVVATDVSDVSLLLGEHRGLIVPAQCPQVLAQAVHSLLGNTEERARLGAAAQRYVTQNHSVAHWFNQLRSLYLRLV